MNEHSPNQTPYEAQPATAKELRKEFKQHYKELKQDYKMLKRRNKAIEQLGDAEILDDGTHPTVRELMIAAHTQAGGVPARTVNAGESSAQLPDLTASDRGRAVLDRLDQIARDRLKTQNRPDTEPSGQSDNEHDSYRRPSMRPQDDCP